jgi:hypothetical protein
MSWYEKLREFFYSEQKAIQEKYPALHFNIKDDEMHLTGELFFRAIYDDKLIDDSYSVDILFPDDYPDDVPVVRELGNKIGEDYHHYLDGTLCLGIPTEVCRIFFEAPNILNFIERLLIPFFYRYSYIQEFHEAPFADCSHGWSSVVEWHRDYFQIDDNLKIYKLLLIVIENKYRGHLLCPCGSKKRLRNCHGLKLRELFDVPKGYLQREAKYILQAMDAPLKQKVA